MEGEANFGAGLLFATTATNWTSHSFKLDFPISQLDFLSFKNGDPAIHELANLMQNLLTWFICYDILL